MKSRVCGLEEELEILLVLKDDEKAQPRRRW
jgi:hypothetical protein